MEGKDKKSSKLKKLFKSKLFWILIVLIIGGTSYAALKPEPKPEYVTTKVVRQDLKQTVSVTGSVQGASEIELNFEMTGVLNELNVAKAEKIKVGDILAKLSSANQYNAVLESEANLQATNATLQKLIAGASSEDIAVSEESVKNTEIAYNNKIVDLQNLKNKLAADENSYMDDVTNKENDLVNYRDSLLITISNELFDADTALNRIKDILEEDDAQNTLGALDSSSKQLAENSRAEGVSLLSIANTKLDTSNLTLSDIDVDLAEGAALDVLIKTSEALSDIYAVLVNTLSSTKYTAAEIVTDKANIKTDQATISASISAIQTAKNLWDGSKSSLITVKNNLAVFMANKDSQIQTAEGMVTSAKGSWDLAKAQLELKKAPTRSEDISLQRAKVAQTRAAVSRARAVLDQMTIYSPIDGLVTRVNYEIGEKTDLGKSVIAVLGESGLEIEVDIPESDVAKIALGQQAMITLDAFGDDKKFDGHVTFIDPAETVIQDVVYYKVKVMFDDIGENIKPGMTANIDIITAEKDNILVVPLRSVKDNGDKYVEVLENGYEKKKSVTIGLRGDEALVEIILGLTEGEEVITYIKELK